MNTGINQDILNNLLEGLKNIQNKSYPLCDHVDVDISNKAVDINKTAHNLQIMIEYFYKSNQDNS